MGSHEDGVCKNAEPRLVKISLLLLPFHIGLFIQRLDKRVPVGTFHSPLASRRVVVKPLRISKVKESNVIVMVRMPHTINLGAFGMWTGN